jgi:hypothetical protein
MLHGVLVREYRITIVQLILQQISGVGLSLLSAAAIDEKECE